MKTRPSSSDIQLVRGEITAEQWDAFAAKCNASFRSTFRASNAWQLQFHFFYNLYRFEVFQNTPAGLRKIGQCAVGVGPKWRVFADGLHLSPEFHMHWNDAMAAILRALGPGRYVYGSDWSLEQPREDFIAQLPGVKIDNIQQSFLEIIDFRRWHSWDEYYSTVSKNIRRNVSKAERSFTANSIEVREGQHIAAICWLSWHRWLMFRKKAVHRSFMSILARSLARAGSTSQLAISGVCRRGRNVVAQYSGIQFGQNAYYMESAVIPQNQGASWLLLISMIKAAWCESEGRGCFVMGSDDRSQSGVKAWEGLVRSRRQCRANSIPISILQFSYSIPSLTNAAARDQTAPRDAF